MSDVASPSRSERLDRALHALLSDTPEIEAAAVVSFDGLPMASALPPSMDEDRVAAMSAALLSLGERAAQGLGRGELSQVYVEGDSGTVFLVSADDEAVLVAVAAQGAKAGMMLFEVRRAAAAVAGVLRADEEPAAAPVLHVPAQPVAATYADALDDPSWTGPPAGPPVTGPLEEPVSAWSLPPMASYSPSADAPAGVEAPGGWTPSYADGSPPVPGSLPSTWS